MINIFDYFGKKFHVHVLGDPFISKDASGAH